MGCRAAGRGTRKEFPRTYPRSAPPNHACVRALPCRGGPDRGMQMGRRVTVATVALLALIGIGCRPPWHPGSGSAPRRSVRPDTSASPSRGVARGSSPPTGGPSTRRGSTTSPRPGTTRTAPPAGVPTATPSPRIRAWTTGRTRRSTGCTVGASTRWARGRDRSLRPALAVHAAARNGGDRRLVLDRLRGPQPDRGDRSPRRDDPNLVGWVTDSELRWGPDWRGSPAARRYLGLPGRGAGRRRARGRPAGSPRVADRYFSVTTAAIHAGGVPHLILGVKQNPPSARGARRPPARTSTCSRSTTTT